MLYPLPNDELLEEQLNRTAHSHDQLTAERSCLLLNTLAILKIGGLLFTEEVRGDFRKISGNLQVEHTHHSRLCNTLTKYLSNIIKGQYKMYAPPEGNDSLGKVIYDEKKFTLHSLEHQNESEGMGTQRTHIGLKELQQLIKKQISHFPTSRDFDFMQTIIDIQGWS